VRETDEGMIVRGARMIATLGPIADEILVYNLPGLKPGDEKYSMIFAIPVGTKGLRQVCREPYDTGIRDPFNHPLATRFEEMDTLTIFDDVLVPWDRVFNHNDVAAANAMYPDTNLRQHTAHQTGVRGLVKMQVLLGVTMAVAKAIGADRHLHVQEMLGEAINYVELVRAAVLRSEYDFETTPQGTLRTMFRPLQSVRTFMPRAYPRMVEILQIIGAGGFMSIPMAGDLTGGAATDVKRYFQGAGGMAAQDKIALFKLAWDLCGDAFGIRQMQYERYYAGDPVRTTAGNYLGYDFRDECERLVERALALGKAPRSASVAAE
jgi:anthranilate 3-monooxygenase (FAD)/4-hydroxyphenylacetate 3-monooxygenase